MKVLSAALAALGMAATVAAHMEMKSPPPFRSSFNPNTGDDVDWDIQAPLQSGGGDFPCKGYLNLLDTPKGRAVATWAPGGTYSFVIHGETPHKGGSCQASVSFDSGRTFKVVHSYVGNCPVYGDSSYSFTLPSDAPAGRMIFAWTWFNNEGNREMYMNCAVVNVAGKQRRDASVSLAGRPDMFVANVGNGVCTYEGTDVEFPNPGPDVTRNTRRAHAPGTGGCGNWGGDGNGAGNGADGNGAGNGNDGNGAGNGNNANGAGNGNNANGAGNGDDGQWSAEKWGWRAVQDGM